ncbi:hypothetical protein VOLCADRAFT_103774 [Volvox carteri f. nagariensis]|uniref:MYND-type domain-containing protein n=1 Tax=Volvox carteri f. nagariensis TaxID=3068 RepID=D8TP41_VOLCA|nr:uncharacterized protein VOLCADRAFT_103774 [Volvox carteri f. nagariensis]EFJ50695.1 hypothetical protein VOLCADRAFT_103774 [Volvox carteri f. nagariensis]|eukprot:XP_002948288.1 hypothetical protein VOLCADRAFT_103774 [Volvox carteri f. nagariensis]
MSPIMDTTAPVDPIANVVTSPLPSTTAPPHPNQPSGSQSQSLPIDHPVVPVAAPASGGVGAAMPVSPPLGNGQRPCSLKLPLPDRRWLISDEGAELAQLRMADYLDHTVFELKAHLFLAGYSFPDPVATAWVLLSVGPPRLVMDLYSALGAFTNKAIPSADWLLAWFKDAVGLPEEPPVYNALLRMREFFEAKPLRSVEEGLQQLRDLRREMPANTPDSIFIYHLVTLLPDELKDRLMNDWSSGVPVPWKSLPSFLQVFKSCAEELKSLASTPSGSTGFGAGASVSGTRRIRSVSGGGQRPDSEVKRQRLGSTMPDCIPWSERFMNPTGNAKSIWVRGLNSHQSKVLRSKKQCLLCHQTGHFAQDCGDAEFLFPEDFFYYERKPLMFKCSETYGRTRSPAPSPPRLSTHSLHRRKFIKYWLNNASVTHIACSVTWPPTIAAIGYAPCVRAWAPTSRDEPEFRPVQQLLEVDGERFVAAIVKAGAPVTSLDASRTFIVAGTAAGYVRVWKRQSAVDATFTQFFAPDLQLDSLPVYCVKLGPLRGQQHPGGGGGGGGGGDGGGGDVVMVVHTRGNGRVSAWRLSDAKIIGTLGRSGPPDSPTALLSANVQHACLARDVLLTCSWLPGADPLLQWIHPVQRQGGEVPGISHHLAGLSRPLSCDYDGNIIVMGCEDGTVWVWGLTQSQDTEVGGGAASQQQEQHSVPDVSHWRGYHRGAVGAVACLPYRGGQVASAGADGCVRLWSPRGELLAVARLGWQVTALAVNEMALVVGGAEGQIQILVLLTDEQAATATSRPTEAERREAQTPPTATGDSPAQGSVVAQYAYWFDARSPKARSGSRSGGESASAGLWGLASEHPDAFAAFVPPRRQVTVADLQQQRSPMGQVGSSGGGGGGGGSTAAEGAAGASDGGTTAAVTNGSCGGGGVPGTASSFNMQAALKGAQRSAVEQAAAQAAEEEAAKRAQLRAMGEGPGVARSRGPVQLESATSATMGRKCANPSCLQREGLLALRQRQQQQGTAGGGGGGNGNGVFKRCGACKSAFYCSAHCQATHWRDGHKKECALLAEAWQRQLQEQQVQEQEPLQQKQPQQQTQPQRTSDAEDTRAAVDVACTAVDQTGFDLRTGAGDAANDGSGGSDTGPTSCMHGCGGEKGNVTAEAAGAVGDGGGKTARMVAVGGTGDAVAAVAAATVVSGATTPAAVAAAPEPPASVAGPVWCCATADSLNELD